MNLGPAVPSHSAPVHQQPNVPHRRLLMAGRALWVVVALLCAGLFSVGVPVRFVQLQAVCSQVTCAEGSMTLDQAQYLATIGLSTTAYAAASVGSLVVSMLVWSTVGLLIFLRRSDSWIAWFVSLFLITSGATLSPVVVDALASAYPMLVFPIRLVKNVAVICLFLFFCLFPDGRFTPLWTRWIVLIYPLVVIASGLFPGTSIDIATWSPLLNWLVLAPNFGVIAFAQVYRYRHSSQLQQRQQTKWVMYGASVALVGLITLILLVEVLNPSLNRPGSLARLAVEGTFTLLMLLIPLTIGVAILRYRLYDIDLIIHRTLVYSALTVCVVGVYVLVVGYLGALFRTDDNLAISLVATGLIAVLFQPLREWLQRRVNRILYGERDEPYAVLARLGRQLETTLAPDALLPTIVQTVQDALKLPYAAITLYEDGERKIVAETAADVRGTKQGYHAEKRSIDILSFPLVYQQASVGELLVAPRAAKEAFSAADKRLLMLVAQQAGVAAHSARLTRDLQHLTSDLQHSREQLVMSREEERRRLRRDLHDGIGPTLASLAQRLDVARNLIERDPAAVAALLVDIKGQVKETIADIRRLVYALRPPVLDEFGLISAVREHIVQMNQANSLHINFHVSDHLPPLPAAVEVATYRMILEAVTNVMRHAQATTCQVSLRLLEDNARRVLHIEIVDDGIGVSPEQRAGVGLMSMRERVAELGGTWSINSEPAGGTRVAAQLPLARG